MAGEELTEGLSEAELAERAGASEVELERMVDLGILVPRDVQRPFLPSDVQKVRLAKRAGRRGSPWMGSAGPSTQGRVSFSFLEAAPFRRWAQRSDRTYEEVCRDAGIPFEFLRSVLEAFGYAQMDPSDRIREDELEVVPLVRQAVATGILDQKSMTRVGRAHAQALWKAAMAENETYHARFEMPALQAGQNEPQALEQAARRAESWLHLVDRALMAGYRRQQELVWTEHAHRDGVGGAGDTTRAERAPAVVFLDLVGYTQLTEERGDQVAAELAGTLSGLVERSSRAHQGAPVKWLGDGVMFHFRDPADAVASSLEMVQEVPIAGLPPAHVGVAAGPVVANGGDYFGRTVNLASRITGRAGAGQVLVSESVAKAAAPDVRFVELGEVNLKGFAKPVKVFEARRIPLDEGRLDL